METVAENMQGYSKRQIRDEKQARELMIAITCPSPRELKCLIKANMLMNNAVTVEDVNRAMDIFGHDVPSLKGKIVRKTPDVVKHEVVHIPRCILCFANTLPFLGTISLVKFGTIQHMVNRKKKSKLSGITTVYRVYGAR